jgi:predicted DNA-binding transcriptional regulator AlpA
MQNQKSTNVNFDELSNDALIREKHLITNQIIPFSPSTLWRRVKSGSFPQPIKISDQITAWRVKDIRDWLKNPSDNLKSATDISLLKTQGVSYHV